MNQPPKLPIPAELSSGQKTIFAAQSDRRPAWRLPAGVAPGTWTYTQTDSIATGYGDFIATTPLIGLDVRLLLENLPSPQPDRQTRVLDLGCGDGRALRALWASGYDVLGVDLSQPMLRQVVAGEDGQSLRQRLIRANLVELDCLADGVADHACCLFSKIGMIQGRQHRRRFLEQTRRVLRPDATLVLHAHNRNAWWRDRPSAKVWLSSLAWSLRDPIHELGDRTYSYRGLSDMFLHTFSQRELRTDLLSAGWKIDQIIPLALDGAAVLKQPNWLASFRAGGFVAVARSPQ